MNRRLTNIKQLCTDISDVKAVYDNGYMPLGKCTVTIYRLLGVEVTPTNTALIQQYLRGSLWALWENPKGRFGYEKIWNDFNWFQG